MSKLMYLACAVLLACVAQGQTKIADGFYLVQKVIAKTDSIPLRKGESFVQFNPDFLENAPSECKGLTILTNEYVPLELASEPVLAPQAENKRKLELTFSPVAAKKLAKFTEQNILKQATLVLNGQALTVNKIRAAITDGKMEITRDDDNTCERIYLELKKNVRR